MKEEEGANPQVRFWLTELQLSEKYLKPWQERSRRIIKRYRDERDDAMSSRRNRKVNIFWSNVETQKPAIYARTPKVVVERRFKDKDPVGMLAGMIAERGSQFQVDDGLFDSAAKEARDDFLLIARGQLWVKYVPEFGAETVDPQSGEKFKPVKDERVETDYVQWEDFLHQRARRWPEVTWVARRLFLTREQLVNEFGKMGEQVKLDYTPRDIENNDNIAKDEQEKFKKAVVWEIWDKNTKSVFHVSRGLPSQFLKEQPAPYDVKGFFPCPKPLFATLTTDSLIPVPDFSFYQDQADQLNDMKSREAHLVKMLAVRGVRDASAEGLERLMLEASEGDLIPVDNWARFAEKGGLKAMLDFMPIREIAEVIIRLREEMEAVKAEIYEVTGIADIVRGVSSPSETAAAQQIKGQYATLRISDRQMRMQEFLRDAIRIGAEIMCETFAPETMIAMTGLEIAEGDQQRYMDALALLKDDRMRSYRVTIETDSTIAIDEAAEKATRGEFLNHVGNFLQKALPIIQTFPQYGPVVTEMLDYGVRAYKAGRQLEGAIRTAADAINGQIKQQQENPQPPPPDPAMVELEQRMQLEQGKMQMEGQLKQAQLQQQAQVEGAKLQLDAKKLEMEWAKEQQRAQLEVEKTQATLALDAEKVRNDIMLKAEGMRQKNKLDTARQTTQATQKGIRPDGKPLKPPIVKKIGKVYRDPVTGDKTVEMIEIPIEQPDDPEESGETESAGEAA